jgi:hypothetical protein
MIDWLGAILAAWRRLAMELSAALIGMLGFGRHSMVSYEGCMLTGRVSGAGAIWPAWSCTSHSWC